MNGENRKHALNFHECKKKGIEKLKVCFYPNCNQPSINSHILQKNGILSSIASNQHVWEWDINLFYDPKFRFKRTGINQAFSFNCFCNSHDNELFKRIEDSEIDFTDYKSCLLFTIRTILNEKFRKMVNLEMYQCIYERDSENVNDGFYESYVENETLGLKDISFVEEKIWDDFLKGTESFYFDFREMSPLDICLSSFFNYDSSQEMQGHINKYGKPMERVSDIFINFFPYKGKSILLMGYHTDDEKKVKGYFNMYFKQKEKKVQRLITNLMLFNCETWAASDALYKKKILPIEELFAKASEFSVSEDFPNERRNFDLNVYRNDFLSQMELWSKKVGPTQSELEGASDNFFGKACIERMRRH
jgi:hypothetical protein